MCSVTNDVQCSPLALQNFLVMIAPRLRVESKNFTLYVLWSVLCRNSILVIFITLWQRMLGLFALLWGLWENSFCCWQILFFQLRLPSWRMFVLWHFHLFDVLTLSYSGFYCNIILLRIVLRMKILCSLWDMSISKRTSVCCEGITFKM